MKLLKSKIEVQIDKIVVTGTGSGYFYVDYRGKIDGKKKIGTYENSWSSQTNQAFRQKLKRGYAIECALRHMLDF